MRVKTYQPTIQEARDLYWQRVAEWDETRLDAFSTWSQMSIAADNVPAARRVWEDAVTRSQDKDETLTERRRRAAKIVNSTLPESLKNAR